MKTLINNFHLIFSHSLCYFKNFLLTGEAMHLNFSFFVQHMFAGIPLPAS